jgi:hypothetical protein
MPEPDDRFYIRPKPGSTVADLTASVMEWIDEARAKKGLPPLTDDDDEPEPTLPKS